MTLRRAYDEIMDRIEVTEEMRRRVLDRIAQEDIEPARPRVLRFPAWKKYLSAAACLILVLTGAAALPRLIPLLPPREGDVQVTSPIQEALSLAELSGLVGFEVRPAALPFTPEETAYCAYWNELAQIQYSGQGQTATYRQSAGESDNSGDYTAYRDVAELTAGGLSVTLKGEAGAYVLAVWTDGGFSYSLHLSQGLTEAQWRAVLDGVPAE